MQAIAADPRNLRGYCELARAYESAAEPRKAEITLLRAIEVDPLAPQPWRQLGHLYTKVQNRRGSVDAYEPACSLDPQDLACRIGYGWALMADQDIRAAKAVCDSVLKEAPDQPEAHLMAGHIHNILGRAEAAAEAYRRVLQADPRRTDAMYHLVDLDPPAQSAAITADLQALRDEAGLSPRDAANVNFALGRIYEAAGDTAEAVAHYEVANAAAAAVMRSLGIAYDPARIEAFAPAVAARAVPTAFVWRFGMPGGTMPRSNVGRQHGVRPVCQADESGDLAAPERCRPSASQSFAQRRRPD